MEQVSISEKLITGQNPWSVWQAAEEAIRQLGYLPLPRTATPEENSVALLQAYQTQGLATDEKMVQHNAEEYDGRLLLMHAFVAFLKGKIWESAGLIILADSVYNR